MSGANEVWGRRLKEARLAVEQSQKDLGVAAGLDPSVASTRINRYELGIHQADYPMSQRLAKALRVPVAYLYCDEDKLARVILAYGRMKAGPREQFLREVEAGQ